MNTINNLKQVLIDGRILLNGMPLSLRETNEMLGGLDQIEKQLNELEELKQERKEGVLGKEVLGQEPKD